MKNARTVRTDIITLNFNEIAPGKVFSANDLLEGNHTPEHVKECVSHAHNFMINACREGLAIQVRCEDGSIKFEKIPEDMPYAQYIKKFFNFLHLGHEMTIQSMYEILPKKFRSKKSISNFMATAKLNGHVKVKLSSTGEPLTIGRGAYIYIKEKNVEITTVRRRPKRRAVSKKAENVVRKTRKEKTVARKSPTPQRRDINKRVVDMENNELKQLMSDMTLEETGKSVFRAVLSQMIENEELKEKYTKVVEERDQLKNDNTFLLNQVGKLNNTLKKRTGSQKLTFKSFADMANHVSSQSAK